MRLRELRAECLTVEDAVQLVRLTHALLAVQPGVDVYREVARLPRPFEGSLPEIEVSPIERDVSQERRVPDMAGKVERLRQTPVGRGPFLRLGVRHPHVMEGARSGVLVAQGALASKCTLIAPERF